VVQDRSSRPHQFPEITYEIRFHVKESAPLPPLLSPAIHDGDWILPSLSPITRRLAYRFIQPRATAHWR
ncbi:MAG: hypothetical protein ABSF70_06745, partial [Terracidiphilus sp.]